MANIAAAGKPVRHARARRPQTSSASRPQSAPTFSRNGSLGAAILEDAHRNGLLEGAKSAHVSFRVPKALIDAAKRETGIDSVSELGTIALAMLAQPDPVAAFMKRTRGRLGRDHKLDY